MRILNVPEIKIPEGLETGVVKPEARQLKRKINLSWEDVILALILIIIVAGLITKELTIAEALAYLGVTTSGGVWGYVSGSKSSKS